MSVDRRGFLRGATALSAAGLLAYAGGAPASAAPPAAPARGPARTRARTLSGQDWLSGIADSVPVQRLTLPGTHDSGARHGGAYVACQTLTIAEQLAAGIRFLDVRCRAVDGVFAIHHAAFYQKLMFGDVLIACRDFLRAHPSETVLMRVKQEYSEVADAEFRKIFDVYLDGKGWRSLFRLDGTLPTLGEARGKVVLLGDNGGLPGVRYGDGRLFDIQDDYMAEPFAKYPKIEAQFRKAAREPGKLYMNYVSTAALMPPVWNANRLNPQVRAFLGSTEAQGWTGLGIVPMDFPTATSGLIEAAIQHNPR
ncbi:phosphatidylinositol-specific phospholipase C [Streptomyces varsoviensis]|uniref:1-phosphatidylinositol phosphodiesterase n=1 Tax=Streptomyces varsoviensis TaxID=67373 RepID=A0ABR5J4B1_9ACTN|nr:phosphatidylinositol-specific phospholipase C [Streptomyces varsoviensis]KOG88292.1 phospholipase [Streptomyces varsoviensis]